ncbi:MAG: hypothetical protein P8Y61_08250 [Gammaproteobacteria bacterium]|jgi:hypothetical protein
MNTAQLQFNIIFTPYTAEYLSPFISTLLEWTDCRYRIVANACNAADIDLLETLCDGDARLEFLVAPGETMIDHGSMLNWLLERTDSPWFCFMDSDIMATGPYMERIAGHLEHHDVFSTGHPLWHSPDDIVIPPAFRRIHGIHFGTTDGKCLGGTYFAIYNSEKLRTEMQTTGVDFRIYRWENVPDTHRETLRSAGLDKLEYDTGMLLMSLMHANGVRFSAEDLENVCHLGGFSSRAEDEPAYYFRGRPDRIAINLLGGVLAAPLFYLADSWYALRRPAFGVSPSESRCMPFSERRLLEGRIRKRRNTARYFKALMQSLLGGTPKPQVPKLGYAPAEQRIAVAGQQIERLYAQYFATHPERKLAGH